MLTNQQSPTCTLPNSGCYSELQWLLGPVAKSLRGHLICNNVQRSTLLVGKHSKV